MKKLMLMLALMLAISFFSLTSNETTIDKNSTKIDENSTKIDENSTKIDDYDDASAAWGIGDYTTAFNLLVPLAEQGSAEAQNLLASMYEFGEGVEQNDREAMKWYRLAAEQGDAEAQFALGWMYDYGKGVLEDKKKAYMWFNVARTNDPSVGGPSNKAMTLFWSPADISEAQDMVERCLASNYKDC